MMVKGWYVRTVLEFRVRDDLGEARRARCAFLVFLRSVAERERTMCICHLFGRGVRVAVVPSTAIPGVATPAENLGANQ